jgi:hypothetical protein
VPPGHGEDTALDVYNRYQLDYLVTSNNVIVVRVGNRKK